MGQSPTEEELEAMFSAADRSDDGRIDFDGKRSFYFSANMQSSSEFLNIARANPLSLSLKAVFDELDVDGDNQITR